MIRVHYCVCQSNKCNETPIGEQMAVLGMVDHSDDQVATTQHLRTTQTTPPADPMPEPPPLKIDEPKEPSPVTNESTRLCFVCGESDLAYPSDCERSYEYDCSRQYPGRSDVRCVTRTTRMASGLFTVEKRCIIPDEHKKQYPGIEVLTDGCGSAWEDYVQYCICGEDYCNYGNMTDQWAQHGLAPPATFAASTRMPMMEMVTKTEYAAPIPAPPRSSADPPKTTEGVRNEITEHITLVPRKPATSSSPPTTIDMILEQNRIEPDSPPSPAHASNARSAVPIAEIQHEDDKDIQSAGNLERLSLPLLCISMARWYF